MSDSEIKVTDKRMFTPDGKLREEYRHLEDEAGRAPEPAAAPEAPAREPAPAAPPSGGGGPAAARPGGAGPAPPPASAAGEGPPRVEIPTPGPGLGQVGFYDLVSLLAEPVALYLGDAKLPDGESAENLELARLHIDLLDLLRAKTLGNLDASELAFLDEVLYRLRMRYVQKRG